MKTLTLLALFLFCIPVFAGAGNKPERQRTHVAVKKVKHVKKAKKAVVMKRKPTPVAYF